MTFSQEQEITARNERKEWLDKINKTKPAPNYKVGQGKWVEDWGVGHTTSKSGRLVPAIVWIPRNPFTSADIAVALHKAKGAVLRKEVQFIVNPPKRGQVMRENSWEMSIAPYFSKVKWNLGRRWNDEMFDPVRKVLSVERTKQKKQWFDSLLGAYSELNEYHKALRKLATLNKRTWHRWTWNIQWFENELKSVKGKRKISYNKRLSTMKAQLAKSRKGLAPELKLIDAASTELKRDFIQRYPDFYTSQEKVADNKRKAKAQVNAKREAGKAVKALHTEIVKRIYSNSKYLEIHKKLSGRGGDSVKLKKTYYLWYGNKGYEPKTA